SPMPTSSNGKDNHSGQHLRTLEPEPPSSSARRESPSQPRTTTPDVVASLASRHNHRSPNPRLRPPLPQRTDGRNQRSRSPTCKRFSHTNQSAAARHLCVENHQKKYPQPHRRNVAGIFRIFLGGVFFDGWPVHALRGVVHPIGDGALSARAPPRGEA